MRRGRARTGVLRLRACLAALVGILVTAAPASAEQSGSRARTVQAGMLDAGEDTTCAILEDATVRCWGFGGLARLPYGTGATIGDDETPAVAGPANLGAGRTAKALASSLWHTCVILDDGGVRCWGQNLNGELGYGNTTPIGDDETPDTAGPVNLGPGRTATAISTGLAVTTGNPHTCAILDDGGVRCWGDNLDGQLGYGNTTPIGDDETPASVGPVQLGPGRTATAITTGGGFSCAILDTGVVRCWGANGSGQLGYGNTTPIGDDETPAAVGPVQLGTGRTAVAISAGDRHTCAILDDGAVRCWGAGADGRLGYGNATTIGDDETPGSVAPVSLGAGRTAVAIAAGTNFTCALLDDGTVHCWGNGVSGRLGYGNASSLSSPGGAVSLGAGRTAVAIATGDRHACALLDNGTLRCWGASAALGYANGTIIGDNELPSTAGPVVLGRPMIGTVADLSVSVASSAAAVTVGGDVTYTVSLRNDGPDPAQAPQLLVRTGGAPTLVSSSTAAGSFDAAGGIWQPGTLASGQTATLTLVERATLAGPLTVSAELVAAPTYDPDSRPANFVTSEDDQASATATATAPTAPPAPPPPPPPALTKVAPERLTLTLAPGKDATAPHVFTATGRLVASTLAPATACTGSVTVTATAGKRTLATRTTSLKLKDGACEYTAKPTISAKARKTARSAKVTAAFAGNDALLAATSKSATAKLA